jgi:hypothetical protein
MYKIPKFTKTSLKIYNCTEGETIEQKVERVTTNKEPIKDGAPLIYTDRKDGVQPGYNIRTDRFEIAVDAMDKIQKSKIASRENLAKMSVVKDGETESIHGNGTSND